MYYNDRYCGTCQRWNLYLWFWFPKRLDQVYFCMQILLCKFIMGIFLDEFLWENTIPLSEIYPWIELNSFPFYFCLYLWCLHSWENSVLVMSIYHNNSITFFLHFFFIFQVNNTKGCTKCCVGRNPYNGYKYLCGSTPTGVFLMQWYG